jgi:hypothetical protein
MTKNAPLRDALASPPIKRLTFAELIASLDEETRIDLLAALADRETWPHKALTKVINDTLGARLDEKAIARWRQTHGV